MNQYDLLAEFYNVYWTQEPPPLFEAALEQLLFPSIRKKSRILDLCCGTGQMSVILAKKGYKVTGLDNSEGMIAVAKENAALEDISVDFVVKDARYFEFENKFDAVISLFDSVNHLMSVEDLVSCFKAVKANLKKGGFFLFDVNDLETFKQNWLGGFSVVENDHVCVLKAFFNINSGVASYHTSMFTRKNKSNWTRKDSTIFEQYYSEKQILEALYKGGFTEVQFLDGEAELNIDAFKGRQFFVAS